MDFLCAPPDDDETMLASLLLPLALWKSESGATWWCSQNNPLLTAANQNSSAGLNWLEERGTIKNRFVSNLWRFIHFAVAFGCNLGSHAGQDRCVAVCVISIKNSAKLSVLLSGALQTVCALGTP
jgi:hypothetical protein